jgi:hypothetical protein
VVAFDRRTRTSRTIAGVDLTMSADGSTLAWVERRGDAYALVVSPATGRRTTAIRSGAERIARPSLSPSGALIAYSLMNDADWDIYVSTRDGGHRRITDDVQHDVLPRFLNETMLLGMLGESRHRRAQLYDLGGAARTRLFSNNTIRTISPEYAWVPSADGSAVVVQADRDGDTISPARGIYVVPLHRRVSLDAVRARIEAQLETERSLRERMTAAFAPVANAIRERLAEMSVARLQEHAASLVALGSRDITQPGHAEAITYLERAYRSFGYEPELQWFEPTQIQGRRTANVLATLRGTESPDVVYIVSSHFDSVVASPGADDNSSGTAVLLETARLLARDPLPATVVFASLTGEESGLLGSRRYVSRLQAEGARVAGVLNNDMIGWSADRSQPDNTIRYSNAGIRDLQHGAAFLFSDLVTYDARYYRNTDAAPFYEAWGDIIGGLGSHPVLANPHYHEPSDRLETLSFQQMLETAKVTAASVILLASAPSRVTGLDVTRTPSATEVRWRPNPETGIEGYVLAYGPAADPMRTRRTVTDTEALLPVLPAGSHVAVTAVNGRGMESWDWTRVVLR